MSIPWEGIKPKYVNNGRWLQSETSFCMEMSRGDYHPRGWVPAIPSRIIKNYSRRGEMVLDQFVGAGTTLMEALMLNRKAIGCDINSNATYLSRELIRLTLEGEGIYVRKKDARRLYGIDDESIDLICTQLPIFGSAESGIKGDMSVMGLDEYILSLGKVAAESIRVLKKGRYCAIMAGDVRMGKCVIPIGLSTVSAFINAGFSLRDVIINQKQIPKDISDKHSSCCVTREYLMLFMKR